MSEKWGKQDSDGPTTESLKCRDRKVKKNGVVEGKSWQAIIVGVCGAGIILIILLVYFF